VAIAKFDHDWASDCRLGQMPDEALAKLIGCSKALVQYHRTEQGLPSFDAARFDWEKHGLGIAADVLVAWRSGRRVAAVREQRHLRGLPCPPEPAQLHGWRTVVDACTDDERIAQRIGIAAHTVAHWRARVAAAPESAFPV